MRRYALAPWFAQSKPAGNEPGGMKQSYYLVADLHAANTPTVVRHYAPTNQITSAPVVVTIGAAITVGVTTVIIRAICADHGACD